MDKHEQMASDFVDDFINRRVRERVFDGRPERPLINAMKADIAGLLRAFDASENQKKARTRSRDDMKVA